jgi:indolepyruvate ferredoxin oxidoreductase, alpha subunit
MAERFFKKEVQKLYLGAGQEFRGEGILAVTKALLQSGVSYVAGYQGAPTLRKMENAAARLKALRETALADDTGKKLENTLAELDRPGGNL